MQRAGGWYLGSDSASDRNGVRTASELWDLGGVVAVTGRSSLVLGHRSSALLAELAAGADRAVEVVCAAWGADWSRRVVIVVPDSEGELHRLLGADRDVSALAAVSTAWSEPGAGNSPSGQRILINPAVFRRLSGTGRSVVLTHEVTHLAVRAVTATGTPSWVVEGFADYVGYSAAHVPVRRAAAELAGDFRASRLPAGLPVDARFAGGPRLAQAYEEAWLAFRLVARRAGPSAPARFYRAAAAPGRGGDAVTRALATVLGMTPHAFTVGWQRYLTEQLR